MDTSFVSVKRGNYAICLHREEGTYPVRTHALQAGNQHPLGIGAGSLAMLSALSDDEVERVLAANRKALETQYALLPKAQIREDVADPRARLRPHPVASSPAPGGSAPRSSFLTAGWRVRFSIAAIDIRMNAERPGLAWRHEVEVERIEGKLRTMFL